jgi:hypothetical protein
MPLAALILLVHVTATAASTQTMPTPYPPSELERIVAPIALYPDPLLAQVLAAATFPDQIPEAARWADEHHYLTGEALSKAIAEDHLPWDPSVQALLPFPSVLDMMASNMSWTIELGQAFLAQHDELMDAVQRLRRKAMEYGYLRSNAQIVVSGDSYIEILPSSTDLIVVPYYDPLVVFSPPPPRFAVASAIRFGYVVPLGPAFQLWGWGGNRILWDKHVVMINRAPWRRLWSNRAIYVHPYEVPRHVLPRPPEPHRLIPRSPHEREAERLGHAHHEEHRRR